MSHEGENSGRGAPDGPRRSFSHTPPKNDELANLPPSIRRGIPELGIPFVSVAPHVLPEPPGAFLGRPISELLRRPLADPLRSHHHLDDARPSQFSLSAGSAVAREGFDLEAFLEEVAQLGEHLHVARSCATSALNPTRKPWHFSSP